jgi:cystathionine beta-synthase
VRAEGDRGLTYFQHIVETIGRTPLVRLNKVTRGVKPLVLAKVESFNPGGSVKDRIGVTIIDAAERQGLLKPGGTIVEATSGNTGVGLAMVAAVRGYKLICTMPDKMSQEKINLLQAYGAEVHIAPTAVAPEHPDSYYEVAKRLARTTPGAFHANQYYNPENPHAHYLTTGPELWEQTSGQIDVFVCGMGTGGTISGAGKYLKEKNPAVQIVGADPVGSILCETTHFEFVDRIITTTDYEAYNMARRVSRDEGFLIGSSGGAAVSAAMVVARELDERHVVVVLVPDTGERYLSKVHSDAWMRDNRLLDPHYVKVGEVLDRKSIEVPVLVSVAMNEPIRSALELIKRYNISQLPVTRNGEIIGCVDEGDITGAVLEDVHSLDRPIEGIMHDPLVSVSVGDSVEQAIKLLANRNAVLVEDFGEPRGILTRYDLIEYVAV